MDRVARAIERARKARHLNALITETFDLAQRQHDQHLAACRTPFTVVVKDNFAVKDVPMTCASAMLANYRAPYTATVVQRLVDKGECSLRIPFLFLACSGGCVVGKANMDEFAMGSTNADSHFGPAKNPRTPAAQIDGDFFVAGGSSGGCAVAVSEGFADVAIGSDTGGSTRNPASFNGVCGFKPSYGLLSRHGLVPLVGVPAEFRNAEMSADCKSIWLAAIERFRAAGAQTVDVSLPHTPYSVVCYHVLNQSDVFSNMSR
ncbi:Glutamyl-tRNA(Gln) amidotransferase subunit A, mitochondrial [Aphelenchoides fujianensis]|nr:Glutamyl-tRNA(Gln) amidotransferase subunit A, mitochondrial [Aphelenchoides fujianensis]